MTGSPAGEDTPSVPAGNVGGDLLRQALDEEANNLVAAGALYALLRTQMPLVLTEIELPDPATNHFQIRFRFLRSAYRITVQRIPDGSEEGP